MKFSIRHLISSLCVTLYFTGTSPAIGQIVHVDQGADWNQFTRQQFYTQDQGSRIMPLSWVKALKQPGGAAFLDGSLDRYGYLPNPNGTEGIAVGFTISKGNNPSFGMTCSACHTRQIQVNGTEYRIDGGPAIVEFQSFLSDLDASVAAVLKDTDSFDVFAKEVIGPGATQEQIANLKIEVDTWYLRYHTLIERSLPDPAWGPSRLDAVSMIFNRLAGLDLGEAPSYLIPENIAVADAPTRYPFLWNAARQDLTQWPGFADNGNEILGLARNLGEVYGVFGEFHPTKQSGFLSLNRDYISNNSANFDGLKTQEDLIWKIGAPRWPWDLDQAQVARGKAVFDRKSDAGGCVDCHGIKTGAFRSPFHKTWATPVLDVGTDRRECGILTRTVKTGVMNGAKIPLVNLTIEETDTAFNVLTASVLGAIVQNALSFRSSTEALTSSVASEIPVPPEFEHLKGAFKAPSPNTSDINSVLEITEAADRSGCAYEARVMEGIWAAAPYLHNGSVPTLEDLLKPADERPASFALGPSYDLQKVGMAATQTRFDYILQTTDCSDLDSGNSRCGHEFGTKTLSETDKEALLEYLKSL